MASVVIPGTDIDLRDWRLVNGVFVLRLTDTFSGRREGIAAIARALHAVSRSQEVLEGITSQLERAMREQRAEIQRLTQGWGTFFEGSRFRWRVFRTVFVEPYRWN